LTSKTKILVSLYQILSSFPTVLNLSFPPTFSRTARAFSVLNLNIFGGLGLSCVFPLDFVHYLMIVTITPVIIAILLLVSYVCHHYFLMRSLEQDAAATLKQKYLGVYLVFGYLSLPGISIYIFQTFNCDYIVDEYYLTADYSISCEDDRYLWARSYAIGMVLLYPIGVPLIYFLVLWRHRDDIMSRKEATFTAQGKARIEPLSFIFSSYEPQYWYWEVIETFRRLLLTGVLVAWDSPNSAIVLGLVITLIFVKLNGYYGQFTSIALLIYLLECSPRVSLS
jgi:hypothetical protein